jgi:hypothetical protein
LTAAPAPSTGFTTQIVNGGSLTNKGAEIGLGLVPVQTRRVTWESHTTYARNRGMVTSLPVPAFYTGSGFGERTARTKVQVGYAPDEVVAFNGFNPNGTRFEQFYGSESPDFTMGFGNDFSVGPFRLSTLIDWRKGGWLADLSQTYLEQGANGQSGIPGGNRPERLRRGPPVVPRARKLRQAARSDVELLVELSPNEHPVPRCCEGRAVRAQRTQPQDVDEVSRSRPRGFELW